MFRLRWAGLVALLRAVGHVLDKVAGKASADYWRIYLDEIDAETARLQNL